MESPKRRILRNIYLNHTTKDQLNCRNITVAATAAATATAAAAAATATVTAAATATVTTTTITVTVKNSVPLFIYLFTQSLISLTANYKICTNYKNNNDNWI